MVESTTKEQLQESRGKVIHMAIEAITKYKIGDMRRKMVHISIESISKHKMSDMERKEIQWVVEKSDFFINVEEAALENEVGERMRKGDDVLVVLFTKEKVSNGGRKVKKRLVDGSIERKMCYCMNVVENGRKNNIRGDNYMARMIMKGR